MSLRRLAATALAMASIAVVLAALSPGTAVLRSAVTHPQQLTDAAGPEAVVLAWSALLAWLTWAWGTLGLALTALSAVPGLVGAAARLFLRAVLPAGARRGAALALGIGLGVGLAAPAYAAPAPIPVPAGAPDWAPAPSAAVPSAAVPALTGPAVAAPRATTDAPDWPAAAPGAYTVVPGDCLWDLAATRLQGTSGAAPGDDEVAAAVTAWWRANAATIGPDPDLLRPGQVLLPPTGP
jgi:nucleoid-associated protein YgaU